MLFKIRHRERLLVIYGFGENYFNLHSLNHGKVRRVNSLDLSDGIYKPGACPPLRLVLKNDEQPLYEETAKNKVYAYPKRFSGKVYEIAPSENHGFISQLSHDSVWTTDGTNMIKSLSEDIFDAIMQGVRELWLSDGRLYLTRQSSHDRKILIGYYQNRGIIVTGDQIDTAKLKNYLPPRYYSKNLDG